jgi:hypothetical protein
MPPAAVAALEGAQTFELLSLSPEHLSEPPADAFHRWKVLGTTKVTDPAVRTRLISALKQGVAENVDGMVASCFNPRHGLRITANGQTTDFVICFECLQVEMHAGGVKSSFLTMSSPQPEFDQVLKSAGIPLAKPAPE